MTQVAAPSNKEEVEKQDPVSAAKSEQSAQQNSVVINFDGVDEGAQQQELFVGSHLRANDQSLNESRQDREGIDSDYLNGEGAISDMIVAMDSDQGEEPNVQNEGIEDPNTNVEIADEEEDDDDVIDIDNPEDL